MKILNNYLITIFIILIFTLPFILTSFAFQDEKTENRERYVLTFDDNLMLRDSSSTEGKIVKKLKQGEKVTVIQSSDSIYDWVKIKDSDNTEGYVAAEFLGFYKPESILKAQFVGILFIDEKNEKSIVSPIAMKVDNKWVEACGWERDYLFLAYKLAAKKAELDVYEYGKKIGKFKSTGYEQAQGCMVIADLTGKYDGPKINNLDEKKLLVTFNMSIPKKDFSLKAEASENLKKDLKNNAIKIFKKNGTDDDLLKTLKEEKFYFFKNPKSKTNYVCVRYAVYDKKDNYFEYSYLFLIAQIDISDKTQTLKKVVFNNYGNLIKDVRPYGGSFHFENIIDLNGDGTPEIIFYNIGYDSFSYSIYTFNNGTWEFLTSGGGDAC